MQMKYVRWFMAAAIMLGGMMTPKVTDAAVPPTSIVVPDGVLGGTVTATISPTTYRFAHAACTQDGVVVYEQWVSIVGGTQATFNLGPTAKWTSGDADCVGDVGKLNGGNWNPVVSDDFHADG